MLTEDRFTDGQRDDFGRVSFRGKLTPFDQQAKEFLNACIRRQARYLRIAGLLVCLLFGGQIAGWWIYFLASGSQYRLVVKVLVSLLFPVGAFILVFLPTYLRTTYVKHPRLMRDLEGGSLIVTEEVPFRIATMSAAGKFRYTVIVDGDKIRAPLRRDPRQNIPRSGEGKFEYFPNTRLCWTYNGDCVWDDWDRES